MCAKLFKEALFLREKDQKWTQCLSEGKWLNELCWGEKMQEARSTIGSCFVKKKKKLPMESQKTTAAVEARRPGRERDSAFKTFHCTPSTSLVNETHLWKIKVSKKVYTASRPLRGKESRRCSSILFEAGPTRSQNLSAQRHLRGCPAPAGPWEWGRKDPDRRQDATSEGCDSPSPGTADLSPHLCPDEARN